MNDLEDVCFYIFEVLPLAVLFGTVALVAFVVLAPAALLWWIFTNRNLFSHL